MLTKPRFYPEERIALVLFVKPADAIAFVSHAQHARRSSLHEYRRLQIAVEWHQGRADKGFVKQARYVTRLALFDRGTRVLRIDKINKRIERDDLLAILKLRLSDEGLIVQCKLVKPRHRYEEEAQYSNEVVLEFASALIAPFDSHFTLMGKQALRKPPRPRRDSISKT